MLGSGERRRRRAARRRGTRSSGGTWKGRIVSKVPVMGRGGARRVWSVQTYVVIPRRASAGVQSLRWLNIKRHQNTHRHHNKVKPKQEGPPSPKMRRQKTH